MKIRSLAVCVVLCCVAVLTTTTSPVSAAVLGTPSAPILRVESGELRWDQPDNGVDVAGHNIHRGDGSYVTTVTETDRWDPKGATGSYFVTAFDRTEGGAKISGRSNTVQFDTDDEIENRNLGPQESTRLTLTNLSDGDTITPSESGRFTFRGDSVVVENQPTWMVVVVDLSGSMGTKDCRNGRDTRLECLRKTVQGVMARLNENYKVAIVPYGGQNDLTNGFVDPDAAATAAQRMSIMNGTNSYEMTLLRAEDLLRDRVGTRQVFLLTDEQANDPYGAAGLRAVRDRLSEDGVIIDTRIFDERGPFNNADCVRDSIARRLPAGGGRCRVYDEAKDYVPGSGESGSTGPVDHEVRLSITTPNGSVRSWHRTVFSPSNRFAFDVAISQAGFHGYELSNGLETIRGSFNVSTIDFVALGDSFSSGAGVPLTEGICLRSDLAYANLIHYPDDQTQTIPVDFRACSSAQLQDLTTKDQHSGVPRQIEHLDASTDLVTMTIGGNDIGFAAMAGLCANPFTDCTEAEFIHSASGRSFTLSEIVDFQLARVALELRRDLGIVKSRAPNATIVLAGYPHLFSDQCNDLIDLIDNQERAMFREKQVAIDRLWASVARQAGVHFVSVIDKFDPYLRCDAPTFAWSPEAPYYLNPLTSSVHIVRAFLYTPGTSWADDLRSFADFRRQRMPGTLHPTALGHQAYAEAINELLASYESQPHDTVTKLIHNPTPVNPPGQYNPSQGPDGERVWPQWLTTHLPNLERKTIPYSSDYLTFESYRNASNNSSTVRFVTPNRQVFSRPEGDTNEAPLVIRYLAPSNARLTIELIDGEDRVVASEDRFISAGEGITRPRFKVPSGLAPRVDYRWQATLEYEQFGIDRTSRDRVNDVEVSSGSRQDTYSVTMLEPPTPVVRGSEVIVDVSWVSQDPSAQGEVRLLRNGVPVRTVTFRPVHNNPNMPVGRSSVQFGDLAAELEPGVVYQWHTQLFSSDWSRLEAEQYGPANVVVSP